MLTRNPYLYNRIYSNVNMGRFGQNNRGGFNRGNSGGNRFGRDSGRDRQMHNITCTKCGKQAQVPFKPTGSKPVLCSDCFRGIDQPRGGSLNGGSLQLDQINAKLDKILAVLSSLEIVADEEDLEAEPIEDDEDEDYGFKS